MSSGASPARTWPSGWWSRHGARTPQQHQFPGRPVSGRRKERSMPESKAARAAVTGPAAAQVPLDLLSTGVPGLDAVLGGGLPALSFNLIAGGPGSGKTTLAMQALFANATVERPGLFLTLLGETSLKML